ncbi:MAG TPA: cytochrome c maturation protein CcmE [Allosphingosinicella sp.]|nr:cytochrome c maturation protein CcmE [Allosphingosinicella sp.]
MKPKNQRLVLILLALAAVGGAVLLAMSALRSQAAFFYSPADVVRHGRPPADRAVRIGGMVRQGSINRHGDGVTIDFLVGDETPNTIRVRYRGITPDLFRENSGVFAEGRFQADGLFVASEILAKHDENYMPPVAAGNEHKSGSLE